jgi:hypothetical protein
MSIPLNQQKNTGAEGLYDPLPPCGGGLGWGVSGPRRRQLSMFRSDRPPPGSTELAEVQPSPTRGPTRGEGERHSPITSGSFNGIDLTGEPVMSRSKFTFLICLFAALHPVTSQAVIIVPTRDPHDDRNVVHRVADNPPVVAFHREADAFRDRLLRWKQRDFLALFGSPVDASKGDEALMVGEPRMLTLSGLHSDNPKDSKDHTGGWPSLEMIRWYRQDGETLARVEWGAVHDGAWRPTAWAWYDRRGEVVRKEADSNGDGIPDVHGDSDLADQEPQSLLAVDRSWAVNPGLIPVELRNPGQPERRVPLRRIPE